MVHTSTLASKVTVSETCDAQVTSSALAFFVGWVQGFLTLNQVQISPNKLRREKEKGG